jgi:hypothetical protein
MLNGNWFKFLAGSLRPKTSVVVDLGFGAGAFGSGYSLQVLGLLRTSAFLWAFRFYPFPGCRNRAVVGILTQLLQKKSG